MKAKSPAKTSGTTNGTGLGGGSETETLDKSPVPACSRGTEAGAGGATDTMGRVLAGFGSGEQLPYLDPGDMKIIASANQSRLSYAPDAKTFIESGVEAFVDPVFFLAMAKGTDPAALAAISTAIDEAVKSEAVAEIVMNATNGTPDNRGPEGTHKMMQDGLAAAKVLFAK